MHGVGNAREVLDDAEVVGLLEDDACHAAHGEFLVECRTRGGAVLGRNELEGYAVEVGIGLHDAAHLRVYGLADEHARGFLGVAPGHHGRLGGGRGAVVHRRIADVESREFGNHRLILKDVVQRSL